MKNILMLRRRASVVTRRRTRLYFRFAELFGCRMGKRDGNILLREAGR